MLRIIGFIAIGFVLVVPYLWICERLLSWPRAQDFLGLGLISAALVYVGFGLMSGDPYWIQVEFIGLLAYSVFFVLAKQFSSAVWLATGWMAHPCWDLLLHWYGGGKEIAPEWYVWACVSFDVATAGYITWKMSLVPKSKSR